MATTCPILGVRMSGQYPIRAAAKLTGLSIDTLRAWERRYQAVVPERSERGRQYSREQIQRLSLLRDLVERGHAIGQIADLNEEELRGLLTARPAVRQLAPEASGGMVEPILQAFLDFRYTQANEELGRLAALLSPRDLVYRVVLPLMRETGERTHNQDMGVAQEHLVSAALRNVLGSVMRLYPSQPGAPKMLIATLSGELHEFGILAAAMVASIAGMDVILFGPNLPARELARAAEKTEAAFVVIGSCGDGTQASDVADLEAGLPPDTELWIGGKRLHEPESRRTIRTFDNIEGFESQCRLSLAPQ